MYRRQVADTHKSWSTGQLVNYCCGLRVAEKVYEEGGNNVTLTQQATTTRRRQ
jgi:hypothetical protein